MAKRRLTLQQKRRIASRQQRHHDKIDLDSSDLSPPMQGLVVARYGKQADVEALDHAEPELRLRCHIRANIKDIVTGDRVIWRSGPETGVIESVLPRDSLMARPDYTGKLKPLAANVDRIAIVFAPQPEPHQNLIDRYLIAAEYLSLTPVLIFNKAELLNNNLEIERLITLYSSMGLPPIRVSAKKEQGIDQLRDAFKDLTVVLVGQSGVGKSSLINCLIPEPLAAIGALSQIEKGKHTTTVSQYYHLPGGGGLIDSPGIREFGLWNMSPQEIAQGFDEFKPYLGTCKFRNCLHLNEPGCAVLEAVEKGIIIPRRHNSYRFIVQELSSQQS